MAADSSAPSISAGLVSTSGRLRASAKLSASNIAASKASRLPARFASGAWSDTMSATPAMHMTMASTLYQRIRSPSHSQASAPATSGEML